MKLKEGIPRHEQISNCIRNKIESGTFKTDEKLPSENKFTKLFDVSRVTVRKALQTLENEQLIYRCQGLGSFVKGRRSHQSFTYLSDFAEDMKRAGMEASAEVIQSKIVPAPKEVAPRLKIDPASTVLRLDRLRLGDGEPIAFDITWLPMLYGQLIDSYDLSEETIYGILEQNYDIPIKKGCYRIEAVNADDYVGGHLNVEQHKALLLIDRLSLTLGDKPVYYQKRYYRSDRIVYQLLVQRNTNTSSHEMPLHDLSPVFNVEDP